MVDIAHEDAETFVIFQQEDVPDDFQIDPNDCMTPQIERTCTTTSPAWRNCGAWWTPPSWRRCRTHRCVRSELHSTIAA
ncbi:MAG TPA: hypothetical protein VN677_02005 [Gemmatimonadaceae bacterium]|nr:hypothetical protein [Gemmatimonadaceae bacterium]